jgi:hypothetical protein
MKRTSSFLASSGFGKGIYFDNQDMPHAAAFDPENKWISAVQDRLEQLIRLNEGWDGYLGLPVTFPNACFAFSMLKSICNVDTPAPQIVPGSSGDLQIEWHTYRCSIELWVRAPNDVLVWREDKATNQEIELTLTTDFSKVADWMQLIVEQPVAEVPTA